MKRGAAGLTVVLLTAVAGVAAGTGCARGGAGEPRAPMAEPVAAEIAWPDAAEGVAGLDGGVAP